MLAKRYERLEREVEGRARAAGEQLVLARRVAELVGLAKKVGKGVGLGRRLVGEVDGEGGSGVFGKRGEKEKDKGLMVMARAAETVVGFRKLFLEDGEGEKKELERVNVMAVLREKIVKPREQRLLALAQQIIREFSVSSLVSTGSTQITTNVAGIGGEAKSNTNIGTEKTNYAQVEDIRQKMTSAMSTFYLLSPLDKHARTTVDEFKPTLLLAALQSYLQTALTSSLAALTRSLATLPTLDRTLLEVSARCQNIVALEQLLKSTKPPRHPLLLVATTASHRRRSSTGSSSDDGNWSFTSLEDDSDNDNESSSSSVVSDTDVDATSFLTPLLSHLDTSSLPSFFWRSLAGSLSSRVREILNKGGVAARNLRSNKDRVHDAIRQCVYQGSRSPAGLQWDDRSRYSYDPVISDGTNIKQKSKAKKNEAVKNWEREAAVMVGAVIGPLGR